VLPCNGIFFELAGDGTNYTLNFVIRNHFIDTKYNITNKLPVGFDPSKGNLYDFQMQWRGVGDVKVFSQSRRQTKVSKWVKRVDLLDLRRRFIPKVIVRKIAQVTGVRSMDRLELDDVVISRGIIKEASEIVIVATDENNK